MVADFSRDLLSGVCRMSRMPERLVFSCDFEVKPVYFDCPVPCHPSPLWGCRGSTPFRPNLSDYRGAYRKTEIPSSTRLTGTFSMDVADSAVETVYDARSVSKQGLAHLGNRAYPLLACTYLWKRGSAVRIRLLTVLLYFSSQSE